MRQTNYMNLAEGDIKYNFQISNTTANNDENEIASIKGVAYFNQSRSSKKNQEPKRKK